MEQVLRHHARTIPDFPAITFEEETLSYRAFDRETNRIANELAAHGVGREDRVAVALKTCPESYLTFFAARQLGAVQVAVNCRSEERPVGKECVSTCRLRWPSTPKKQKKKTKNTTKNTKTSKPK